MPLHASWPRGSTERVRTRAEKVTCILLSESQTLFRQGLRQLLGGVAGMRVVGEARTVDELMQRTFGISPDLILTDIEPVIGDALEAMRAVRQRVPAIKIVVLTGLQETRYVTLVAEAGAQAFIPKTATTGELIEILRRVAAGETLLGANLPPSVASKLTGEKPKDVVASKLPLTPAEKVLLRELARGGSNVEIARALDLSEKAVRNKLSVIYDKLELHNRTQAALYAVQNGIACL